MMAQSIQHTDDQKSIEGKQAKGKQTKEPIDPLVKREILIAYLLLIPEIVLSISFGTAGTLTDILAHQTGFSWAFLGDIEIVLGIVSIVLAIRAREKQKTTAGRIVLALGILLVVVPLLVLIIEVSLGAHVEFF